MCPIAAILEFTQSQGPKNYLKSLFFPTCFWRLFCKALPGWAASFCKNGKMNLGDCCHTCRKQTRFARKSLEIWKRLIRKLSHMLWGDFMYFFSGGGSGVGGLAEFRLDVWIFKKARFGNCCHVSSRVWQWPFCPSRSDVSITFVSKKRPQKGDRADICLAGRREVQWLERGKNTLHSKKLRWEDQSQH